MTMHDDSFDLAVIGGGPAGLASVRAARRLAPHWRVAWCRGRDVNFLPAYGGVHTLHRLNVVVERMGLDAEAPSDFFEWLQQTHPERGVEPDQFVPRGWFGEYLAMLATDTGADERLGDVATITRDADGLHDDWRIEFKPMPSSDASSPPLRARRIALCLGMPAGLPMPQAPPHWMADAWAWWRALPPDHLPIGDADTVLVVGSGLTAVDMLLGLRARGFRGQIRTVSRDGRWSQPHAAWAPLDDEAREALECALDEALSARAMLSAIRRVARLHPWRAVIDALRANTNARWAALGIDEQRRVLRHAFGVWNRHRHRMAPDVLATLHADAALSIETGRIGIDPCGRIVKRHRGTEEVLDVSLALDCRGPGFQAALAGDSLLARLVRSGVLEAHPLGTGVRVPRDSSLAVLGAARFGECFETIAVPELRQQALVTVTQWLKLEMSIARGERPSLQDSLA